MIEALSMSVCNAMQSLQTQPSIARPPLASIARPSPRSAHLLAVLARDVLLVLVLCFVRFIHLPEGDALCALRFGLLRRLCSPILRICVLRTKKSRERILEGGRLRSDCIISRLPISLVSHLPIFRLLSFPMVCCDGLSLRACVCSPAPLRIALRPVRWRICEAPCDLQEQLFSRPEEEALVRCKDARCKQRIGLQLLFNLAFISRTIAVADAFVPGGADLLRTSEGGHLSWLRFLPLHST
eukprot:1078507-Prymnesium_polylepis.1